MKKTMKIVGFGIACVLLLLLSSWDAIVHHQSRLVVPMDYSTYVFQSSDLPMILSVLLVCAYVCYLFVYLLKTVIHRAKTGGAARLTRQLNPKWGIFGFAGFLGFLGFWTYSVNQTVFPFCFFLFFGFFGFFFEGKMSNTLIDERFQENALKAQLTALKIGFLVIILSLFLFGRGKILGNLEYTAIALIISVSTALGLVLFLSEYLLYRYDHEESCGEDEET